MLSSPSTIFAGRSATTETLLPRRRVDQFQQMLRVASLGLSFSRAVVDQSPGLIEEGERRYVALVVLVGKPPLRGRGVLQIDEPA